MEFTNFSEWVNNFSLQSLLEGNIEWLVPILYLVISIAIYSIIIWHYYRLIAKRDCFKMSGGNYPKIVGFVKYFFLFPFVAFVFFLGFTLLLLFLTQNLAIESVLSTAFAVIIAIRITSYYSEDLSKDVAKMLPFALLGIFLVDPSYFDFDITMSNINSLPSYVNIIVMFLIIMIIVEWLLRIALAIRYALFPKKKNLEIE
jgi:hypothetical protein